ncbi:MAG TPA: ATP-binding cassette domain-containing protein [Gaiellaceae bacterium]|nr:ATP-binding cassette domain-containing protein [Gaiellaceae bacterium]
MIAETGTALRGAWDDARASWSSHAWLALALLAVAALVPFVLPGSVRLDGLAETAYLAAAAIGLGFAIGIGGMPSVAQGAFVGVGALVAAHLAPSWPPVAAALLGGAAAAAGGVAVGAAIVRFRPVYVAAATWIVTWLFALGLDAFPSISGGAAGLAVTPVWTPTVHYEVALGLVALALLGHWALARSSFGLSLRAAATRPAAAAALGVEAPRLRLRAFAGSAALAGLAGGFAVQLVGVADPAAYGPLLSFKLLVAVLVGGAVSALGPAVGMLVVASLTPIADALGRVTGAETARFGPMLAALLLLAFLTAGGEGLVPLATRRLRRGSTRDAPASSLPTEGAGLDVSDLTKRFGGLIALDGLGLRVEPGRTVALIGPNGSGKTTALRLLAGTMEPDGGRIALGGADITRESTGARVRRGLVRTLQANAVFAGLTTLENAVVGASVRRRHGGAFRTLVATPKARAEDRETLGLALAALDAVGLAHRAGAPAETLSTAEQRLLMLASALATSPRALLVDEPSAAAGTAELERLTGVLSALGEQGLALLIVEHNLRLVRSLADEVVVLDAGKRLAAGTPDEIARHPAVRAAYLGRQPF